MDDSKLIECAHYIRDLLLVHFPEKTKLDKQCKRAAILFHLWCQENGIRSRIVSGHIANKQGDFTADNGHVWNKVWLNNSWYIVDSTMTQFEPLLHQKIPDIIYGEETLIYNKFPYREDGKGDYPFHRDDVRFTLIQHVLSSKVE